MVQQLKGNIRVYCRVRPLAADEDEDCVRFPDENELEFWDAERYVSLIALLISGLT